jgi:hypothetical protein
MRKPKQWLIAMISLIVLSMSALSSVSAEVGNQQAQATNIMKEIYVANTGNDTTGDGSLSNPFATIERARDEVRTINQNMTGNIYVYLRGGNYRISNTITLGQNDSGTNGFNIIYQAYSNEKPVISGGQQVSGWTQDSTNPNIYKAPLTRNTKLRALYIDGKRASMTSKALGTAAGGYGTYTITAGQDSWAWASGSQSAGTVFNASALPLTTRNQSDIELETQATWNRYIVTVDQLKDIGNGRVAAMLQQPYGSIAQRLGVSGYSTGGTQTVYNVFEWLTSPGQFYFDRQGQTLYYYPRAGEDLSTSEVIAPSVETLVRIEGTPITGRTNHITFKGISFAHADYNLYHVGNSSGASTTQGATIVSAYGNSNDHQDMYRNFDVFPGAIKISSANDIQILDGEVKLTGAVGISIENDVQNIKVTGNFIYSTGGSAISIGHPQHVYENDPASYQGSGGAPASKEKFANGTEGVPTNISVTNNYILEPCKFFLGSAGVMAFYVDTLTLQHNRIENTPYQGISLGWGWWKFNGDSDAVLPNIQTTTAKNNNISYNQFINTMSVLNDGAPIYTLGSQPVTTISNNYIKGVPPGHKYALHPDEASAYISLTNNLLDVDPGILHTIEWNDWGRKHDLTITQNYATVFKESTDPRAKRSIIQDVMVYTDAVWPTEGYSIAVNSGLEAAYKNIVPSTTIPLQDYVLPASVFADDTTSIPIRAAGDVSKFVWLAPSGTTSFTEGSTMTKASGSATSIAVPEANGIYKLYIVDGQGNRSAESASQLRVGFQGRQTNLVGITAPSSLITASIGTAKTALALGLPATVQLVTDYGNVDSNVTWDLSGINYNPSAMNAQGFNVPGTVALLRGIANPSNIPLTVNVSVIVNKIPQSNITATATSQETAGENDAASNAIDGNPGTIWHTKWDKSNVLPQSITLNLGGAYNINKVAYLPRPGGGNGTITGYNVYVSTDGVSFTKVANGNWANDATEKFATFTPTNASYVKLEATAGVNGYASAAEIGVTVVGSGVPNLLSITAPAAIKGVSGTEKTAAALGLPATVELVTDKEIVNANVAWKVDAANYDPTVKTAQTFTVSGTVALPTGVANPNNVPLITNISVTVQYVGKVEAENYVNMSGIVVENNSDGTKSVGYIDPGDWMDYVVNVPVTGVYKVNYRVAVNSSNGGKVNFLVDGVSQKMTSFPSTGGWHNWNTVSDEVSLSAGTHTIRLGVEASGWNFNWFELVAPPAPATPKSTLTGVQQVTSGQTFDVTMGLSSVTQSVYQSVYGQVLTVHYDPQKLQLETATPVTSLKNGFQVIETKELIPGQFRIVAASVGANVPAQGDLLAIKFRAKSVTQETNTAISVDNVVIANAQGNELQVGGASREIQITVPTIPVDKSLLNATIGSAQTMYDTAVEGNGDGLYAIGSKAQLQLAIDAAKAAVNNSNATQQQVDSAKAALEAAMQVFTSKKITTDINGGGVSIGDLAVVAAAYGKQQGQVGWNEKADVNHDGKVDIVDLAIVAKAILQ